jgi:hypothetical protein
VPEPRVGVRGLPSTRAKVSRQPLNDAVLEVIGCRALSVTTAAIATTGGATTACTGIHGFAIRRAHYGARGPPSSEFVNWS